MAEFLSLSCKSCGAKLEPTIKQGVFACPACGNEYLLQSNGDIKAVGEHIVISGSQVNLGGVTAVECPICGKKNKPEDTFHCRTCNRDDLCEKHQNPHTHQCIECTPLYGAAAVPPIAATNVMVECPICGKHTVKENTFHCKHCGRDDICITHQDPEMHVCKDCRKNLSREYDALMAERNYLSDLESALGQKIKTAQTAYSMIEKHKGKAYRNQVFKSYYKALLPWGIPVLIGLATIGILVLASDDPMPMACFPIIIIVGLIYEFIAINAAMSKTLKAEIEKQKVILSGLEQQLGL